jgi:hypothetical protein
VFTPSKARRCYKDLLTLARDITGHYPTLRGISCYCRALERQVDGHFFRENSVFMALVLTP